MSPMLFACRHAMSTLLHTAAMLPRYGGMRYVASAGDADSVTLLMFDAAAPAARFYASRRRLFPIGFAAPASSFDASDAAVFQRLRFAAAAAPHLMRTRNDFRRRYMFLPPP